MHIHQHKPTTARTNTPLAAPEHTRRHADMTHVPAWTSEREVARQVAPETDLDRSLRAHQMVHMIQPEGEHMLAREPAKGKRRRAIPITEIRHPRVVLYQNHAVHAKFFSIVARRITRERGGLELDLSADECPVNAKFGIIPFDSGADIIKAIESAHECTGRPVEEVHIVSHSGPSGIYGTGSFFDEFGLYSEDKILDEAAKTGGGRTLDDLPTEALAENVVFVMHGCATAMGDDSFAEHLLKIIVGTSPKARVFGHRELGEAGRKSDWTEFTAKNPEGRRRKTNPFHK